MDRFLTLSNKCIYVIANTLGLIAVRLSNKRDEFIINYLLTTNPSKKRCYSYNYFVTHHPIIDINVREYCLTKDIICYNRLMLGAAHHSNVEQVKYYASRGVSHAAYDWWFCLTEAINNDNAELALFCITILESTVRTVMGVSVIDYNINAFIKKNCINIIKAISPTFSSKKWWSVFSHAYDMHTLRPKTDAICNFCIEQNIELFTARMKHLLLVDDHYCLEVAEYIQTHLNTLKQK